MRNTLLDRGSGKTRESDPGELPKVLSELFDIDLTEADATVLTAVPWIER